MRLNEIELNRSCYIKSLSASGGLRMRMQDLGLIEGTEVKAVFRAPFGDPTAYLVRGTLLALRNSDAEKICVDTVKENE